MKKSYYYQALALLITMIGCLYSIIAAASENNLIKQKLISEVEQFVKTELNPGNNKALEVSAMPIDKRINIPHCQSPLLFSASPEALSQSNITVKAKCQDNDWYMFLMVKATEIQPVVVISRAVSPGTLLTSENTQVINMDKKRLRSTTFADKKEVIGARIKRRVAAGRPVEPNNLCYVCKGDSVTISAGSSVMQVKTNGIALEDGKMGDTIQVKNSRSNIKIYARVTSSGQVEINI